MDMIPELADRASKELELQQAQSELKEGLAGMPKKIDSAAVQRANEILKKYKKGKQRLEQKLIANEEYWKLRQWRYIAKEGEEQTFNPATPWLWSCIQSRYSDVMDSYPTCNIQPRQQDDKNEAKILSDIVPVIMAQNDYEETYSAIAWYMLKQGGSVQGVFWDGSKHNGLGDISIKKVDFLNLFFEPAITDIQQSAHVFYTELVDNELLEQRYPECKGKLNAKPIQIAHYIYDESIDTTGKSVVIDWYYHTEYNGRKALQYVKYVNDIVLYATENDTEVPTVEQFDEQTGLTIEVPSGEPMSVRGLYDHAMYPFVVASLYPIENSLCGYGLTDIGRDTQTEIDLINKAITENAVAVAKPRYFVRGDGSINEKEFTDFSKTLVHVQGALNDDYIKPVQTGYMTGIYTEQLQNKIQELKYCTSNQDANNGVAPSGITAASAISALQETAGKNARSTNKSFHRAYREVVYMVIELIRQFYDTPRTFRIAPDSAGGDERFVEYSNAGIVPQPQMMGMNDMGLRLPEFDIEVSTEKDNPYKKMEINELALNFYGNGFFNPQMADQALEALKMMDFKKKDEVMQSIEANGTMYQQLLQYQQLALQLAKRTDPALADQIAQSILQGNGQPIPQGEVDANIDNSNEEHPFVQRARAEARASTQAD